MVAQASVRDPAIRAELEALIAEHAYRLDHRESDNLGDLYTEDGCLYIPGKEFIGRDAVNEYGRGRAAATDRRVRHVSSTYRFVEDGPDQIRGNCYITLFRSFGEALGPADAIALADAQDIYRCGADGAWRIRERRIVLAFESEAHKIK